MTMKYTTAPNATYVNVRIFCEAGGSMSIVAAMISEPSSGFVMELIFGRKLYSLLRKYSNKMLFDTLDRIVATAAPIIPLVMIKV